MSDFVPVTGYRSTVTSVPGGIAVSIPSRRNYFVAAFLCVWLCGWYFGETSALHQLMSPSSRPGQDDSGFLIFWLCGWTLGGCFALVMALWSLAGREMVTVQSDAFTIRREAFGLGMSKRYELRSVKNLRVVETAMGVFGSFGWGRRDPFGSSSGRSHSITARRPFDSAQVSIQRKPTICCPNSSPRSRRCRYPRVDP